MRSGWFPSDLCVIAILAALGCASSDPVLRAVTEDPLVDARHRAAMEAVLIPSGEVHMNGVLYVAAGPGPHPAVVLLHGFPGNEQNLDLAQAMRRAGWSVLSFHYRGSWGGPGAFSFTHAIEDARAALAFLRAPANARRYRVDPSRLVVVGHSMGAFIAAMLADDPSIAGLGLVAAWDAGAEGASWARASAAKLAEEARAMRSDTVPLAGTTAEALIQEVVAHHEDWTLGKHAARLGMRAVLVISTDDGAAAASEAYAAAARATARVTAVHLPTDHALSDHRMALQVVVARWLATVH